MSNYIVSARKYRPLNFDSVVGQSALTTTLKNSIASGRLAHAYLFSGPRGVGKTTCARIFAKTINCLSPKPNGEACETCESCKAFNEGRSYNIHELDAASNNGVDQIRELIEQVSIPPQVGRYKVFIIDEVHMLSTAAFNAFLKTLEEPPAYAIFILATTEKHKLLPTIISRCQIYDFKRITVQDTVSHLEHVAKSEGITYETEALNVIAQKADGGMRDALSIFDQVTSFCQGNITYQQTITDLNVLDHEYYFRLVDSFLENKITDIMLTFNEILSKGFEGSHFIGGLNRHLRNLLVSQNPEMTQLIETSDNVRQRYAEQARRCKTRFLYTAMRKCTDCDINYKASQNKRLLIELTLIEIAQSAQDDGSASGPGPTKILKPIFTQTATQTAQPSAQPAGPAPAGKTAQAPASHQRATDASPVNLSSHTPSHDLQMPSPQSQTTRHAVRGFSITRRATATQSQAASPTAMPQAAVMAAQTPQAAKATKDHVTETEMLIAWRTFINGMPQEQIAMANRMTNMQPNLDEAGKNMEIIADNPVVEQEFKAILPSLQQNMAQTLQFPQLTITVRARTETDQKTVYSKKEMLEMMCKENHSLDQLIQQFGLVLA